MQVGGRALGVEKSIVAHGGRGVGETRAWAQQGPNGGVVEQAVAGRPAGGVQVAVEPEFAEREKA